MASTASSHPTSRCGSSKTPVRCRRWMRPPHLSGLRSAAGAATTSAWSWWTWSMLGTSDPTSAGLSAGDGRTDPPVLVVLRTPCATELHSSLFVSERAMINSFAVSLVIEVLATVVVALAAPTLAALAGWARSTLLRLAPHRGDGDCPDSAAPAQPAARDGSWEDPDRTPLARGWIVVTVALPADDHRVRDLVLDADAEIRLGKDCRIKVMRRGRE